LGSHPTPFNLTFSPSPPPPTTSLFTPGCISGNNNLEVTQLEKQNSKLIEANNHAIRRFTWLLETVKKSITNVLWLIEEYNYG
jgi:hypothetical protein